MARSNFTFMTFFLSKELFSFMSANSAKLSQLMSWDKFYGSSIDLNLFNLHFKKISYNTT